MVIETCGMRSHIQQKGQHHKSSPHLCGLVCVRARDVLGDLVPNILVVCGMVLLRAWDVALDLLTSGLGRLLVVQRPGHSLLQVVPSILIAVAVAVSAREVILQATAGCSDTLFNHSTPAHKSVGGGDRWQNPVGHWLEEDYEAQIHWAAAWHANRAVGLHKSATFPAHVCVLDKDACTTAI